MWGKEASHQGCRFFSSNHELSPRHCSAHNGQLFNLGNAGTRTPWFMYSCNPTRHSAIQDMIQNWSDLNVKFSKQDLHWTKNKVETIHHVMIVNLEKLGIGPKPKFCLCAPCLCATGCWYKGPRSLESSQGVAVSRPYTGAYYTNMHPARWYWDSDGFANSELKYQRK